MSKKINEAFLKAYNELEALCCDKFGVATGGVAEYINRLNNAKFAPDRDEVLPRLVRYRNVNKRFVFDPAAIKDRKNTDVAKEDVKWVNSFCKAVKKKKDPIAKYLKKARRYARNKKFWKVFWIIVIILAVLGGGVAALYFLAPELFANILGMIGITL